MATILIIDGHVQFRTVLARVLTSYRHDVHSVSSGDEGLRLAATLQPDLVLLDLTLAGAGSGLEVLAKLRARAPRMPVIGLADTISVEMETRARELGATALLRKGLKMDVIMDAITRALKQVESPGQGKIGLPTLPAHYGGTQGAEAAKILIVDDEFEIRELLKEFLEQRGYRTDTAATGTEALAKIKGTAPDLVLLDIYMPEMNGVEILRR